MNLQHKSLSCKYIHDQHYTATIAKENQQWVFFGVSSFHIHFYWMFGIACENEHRFLLVHKTSRNPHRFETKTLLSVFTFQIFWILFNIPFLVVFKLSTGTHLKQNSDNFQVYGTMALLGNQARMPFDWESGPISIRHLIELVISMISQLYLFMLFIRWNFHQSLFKINVHILL